MLDYELLFLYLFVIAFFSLIGFWKWSTPAFMLTAGASVMLGLTWYDLDGTDAGLGISILFIGYAFACLAFAYGCLFRRGTEG